MKIRFNGYTCEYCYDVFHGDVPPGWEMVVGCYICPSCQPKVIAGGGINVVNRGAFAKGRVDPRSKMYEIGDFKVGELAKMKYGNALYPSKHDIFRIDQIVVHPRFGGDYPEVGVIISSVACPFCGYENSAIQKELSDPMYEHGIALGWMEKINA